MQNIVWQWDRYTYMYTHTERISCTILIFNVKKICKIFNNFKNCTPAMYFRAPAFQIFTARSVAYRGIAMTSCLSVRLSVCNVGGL